MAAFVAVVAWYELGSSRPPERRVAAAERPTGPQPDMAPTPPPAVASALAPSDPATAESGAARVAAGDDAADERTVVGMYQNMADAVDAYGPGACAGLGQAFVAFVADGAPATGRLVRSSADAGQDYSARLEGLLGPHVDHVRAKLKEAVTRCSEDPGVVGALRTLASLK